MATAAERLSDELVRHAIDLERLEAGTAQKIVALLRGSDAAMAAALRERLKIWGETGTANTARKAKSLQNLIDKTLAERRAVWTEVRQAVDGELTNTGKLENQFQAEALEDSIGLEEVGVAAGTAAVTRRLSKGSPVEGARVIAHLRTIERAERETIRAAVQGGAVDGAKADDIVDGLRGTRSGGFKDGSLQTARRNLGTAVQTGMVALVNTVRQNVWQESGIVAGQIWVAILDGRTTLICQSRDGRGTPYPGREDDFPAGIPRLDPPDARPPAHFNCRSHLEAVLADQQVIKPHRVTVTSTIPDKNKTINFRNLAKRKAGDRWRRMTERQRRRLIRVEQNTWAAENIGTVAPQTTYPEFLARQSAKFQDSVLGPTRGALFRRGDLPIDKFVDFNGKPVTLDLLKQQNPAAFRRAGID
ncbi:MAG: hypothetical protein V3S78_02170 [Hyphomicrobium sp.]